MAISRIDHENLAVERKKSAARKIRQKRKPQPHTPSATETVVPAAPSQPPLPESRIEAEPEAMPDTILEQSPPAPPDEPMPAALDENRNDAAPSSPTIDFNNRFDSVRTQISQQFQEAGQSNQLLEQAITLLETVAAQSTAADYSSLQQRLDNVEQILNSSGNVR